MVKKYQRIRCQNRFYYHELMTAVVTADARFKTCLKKLRPSEIDFAAGAWPGKIQAQRCFSVGDKMNRAEVLPVLLL